MKEFTISGSTAKVMMIKLGHSLHSKAPVTITEKEQAKFVLEQSSQGIEENMSRTQAKIEKLHNEIMQLVKMGSKRNALRLLAQKKNLEGFWERLSGQRYQLEEQLLNLEELETHSVIIDVLDLAEKAGKKL